MVALLKMCWTVWILVHFACSAMCSKDGVSLEFNWRNAEFRNIPKKGLFVGGFPNYIRENNIIYGIAYDALNDVMYASIPRSAPGVPATLVMLENVTNIRDLNPIFTPFPHLPQVNQLRNCDFKPKPPPKSPQKRRKVPNPKKNHHQLDYSFDERFDLEATKFRRTSECDTDQRLISTFEPVLDKCGRLWVIDSGVLENNGEVVVKNAQLWAFDVKHGPGLAKLIRRFDFPTNVVKTGRGLFGLTVDILNGQCDATFVYIPNLIDGRIVVYDFFRHDAWYFENYSFEGDATESDFTYEDGLAIRFQAGISSIALGPEEEDSPGHFRTAYYTAGSSTGEYSISTRVLRDRKNSPDVKDVSLVGYRGKDSQAMVHLFDEENGVLFFAELQSGRVRCWNTQKPLRPENIETIFESKKFVYGSHISIDSEGNLWFMSNNYAHFQAQLYHHLRKDIRLYKTRVVDAIAGTLCEPRRKYRLELTEENIGQYFNVTQVIYNKK